MYRVVILHILLTTLITHQHHLKNLLLVIVMSGMVLHILRVAHTFESTNDEGCTNVATLTLVINNSESTSEDITACDSWSWDGVDYTESGLYSNTYTNVSGCDSTHTVNLTINSSTSFEEFTTCDSYEWNGTIY